jgi:hypothetical protein
MKFFLIFIFQTERAVAMKLLIIIFVWVAAWTPFCMILIIQMAGYDQYINNVVSAIVTVVVTVTVTAVVTAVDTVVVTVVVSCTAIVVTLGVTLIVAVVANIVNDVYVVEFTNNSLRVMSVMLLLFLFLLLLLFSLQRQFSQFYCCSCNFFPLALRKVMFGFSFVLYSLRDNS